MPLPPAASVPGDASSKDGVKAIIEGTRAVVGDRLDVLICNAGIDRTPSIDLLNPPDLDKLTTELFDDVEWSSFAQTFDINTTALYFLTMGCLPLLRKSDAPSVINISSVGAFSTERSIGGAAYNASKAAVVQLTRVLAAQLIPFKVRVNSIAPGLFLTEMTEPDEQAADEKFAKLYGSIPLGRAGKKEEIAASLLFLGSPAGGYVNAATLVVDGGHLIMSSAQD
jgi:NAD(P)-dependent dehydrogenase (short-subunit alcohol dehydrogenase family)